MSHITPVKANQKNLLKRVHLLSTQHAPYDTHVSQDKCFKRGRKEKRTIELFDPSLPIYYGKDNRFGVYGYFSDSDWNKYIQTVVKVTRIRKRRIYKNSKKSWKQEKQIQYYISNQKSLSAKKYSLIIRSHWNIENCNHYVRDHIFKEDASRIRVNPGALARIRSIAMNVLRSQKTECIQGAVQRNGWSEGIDTLCI